MVEQPPTPVAGERRDQGMKLAVVDSPSSHGGIILTEEDFSNPLVASQHRRFSEIVDGHRHARCARRDREISAGR